MMSKQGKIIFINIGKFTSNDPIMTPPMGICYLAAVMRKSGFKNVHILDMKIKKMNPQEITEVIKKENPAIVGLSAMTYNAGLMLEVANKIKQTLPDVKLIVGGAHATIHYDSLALEPSIDLVAVGETEGTIENIVKVLLNNGNLSQIKGIAFAREGKVIFTGSPAFMENLDSLPYPAFDLLDLKKYFKTRNMSTLGPLRYLPIFTSRGCPYQCAYCHHVFGKKFRGRSPDNVIDEIKYMQKNFNIHQFLIYDDTFNFERKRMHEILDSIVEQKLNISFSFPNALRGDILNEEDVKKLKAAGVNLVTVAVETASARIQKLIKKNLDLKKIVESINLLNKYKILIQAFFMLGFPTETEEEVKMTIDFAVKSQLHLANFFIVVPFERTGLWDLAKKYSKLPAEQYYEVDYWLHDFNLSTVATKRLHQLQKLAYRKFFLDIKRIVRIIIRFPYKLNMFWYSYVALKRLFRF
ncbi:MAG: radical SAM protein [Candidatus Omnitrophota bacterium]